MIMNNNTDFCKLLEFVSFFHFNFSSKIEFSTNNNICAILADCVLQSGMNYKTVVLPRVNRILDRYPNYTSIDYFISDLDENTIQEILMWKGVTRQRRFFKLATFLYDQDVYTSQELKSWISIDTNQEHLLQIEGIGPKSIDYLSLLVGNSAIPIDRHLCNFAVMSGVTNTTYSYLSELYKQVCDFLRIEYHKLDCIIWNFMNSLLA